MIKKKIFIFEFVAGGGFKGKIPASLFCEGFGMLRAIITDFTELDFEVTTLLDYRISFLSRYLVAQNVNRIIAEEDFLKSFERMVKDNDYCFIIAPEFSSILYDLTKIAIDNGKEVLSIDLDGIKLGASKWRTYNYFIKNGINTPRTWIIPTTNKELDVDFIVQKFKELDNAIIIKPDDGVGAESIYYFKTEKQISDFFNEKNDLIEKDRRYIVQEFIDGEDLSVSLINNPQDLLKLRILSVNTQDIDIKNQDSRLEYLGGHTPVEDIERLSGRLSRILQNLELSEFNGYIGVDFIQKSDGSIHFIEINPRLTTSYLGIRNILNINPVEYILKLDLDRLDSREKRVLLDSVFSRLELSYEGTKSIQEIYDDLIPQLIKEIPEIVTPPISFEERTQDGMNRFSCFVATKCLNFKASLKRMKEICEILKEFNFKTLD